MRTFKFNIFLIVHLLGSWVFYRPAIIQLNQMEGCILFWAFNPKGYTCFNLISSKWDEIKNDYISVRAFIFFSFFWRNTKNLQFASYLTLTMPRSRIFRLCFFFFFTQGILIERHRELNCLSDMTSKRTKNTIIVCIASLSAFITLISSKRNITRIYMPITQSLRILFS